MLYIRFILAAAAVFVVAPSAGLAADTFEAAPGQHGPVRRGSSWDLNIDLAYGLTYMPDEQRQSALARVRAGWLLIHEPWFPSLGIYADISNTLPASFGVQAEAIHLWSGLWGQLGLFADVKPRFGASVAAGYSIFGVEANGRFRADKSLLWTVFAKLRIPVGMLYLAMRRGG